MDNKRNYNADKASNWWEGETGRQEIAALIRGLDTDDMDAGSMRDVAASVAEKPWKWTAERDVMVTARKVPA